MFKVIAAYDVTFRISTLDMRVLIATIDVTIVNNR